MPKHVVQKGECLSSIADRYGHFWETLWNHEDNRKLRELRGDPNVLRRGDEVFVPDIEPRSVSLSTGRQHRFRLRGVPALFRIQLFHDGAPRSNQTYTLDVDGEVFKGTTDGQGVLRQPVPPGAVQGKLTVGPDEFQMDVLLGELDPVSEITGIKQRLSALGYECGDPSSDAWDDEAKAGLIEFQYAQGLEPTGEVSEEERELLGRLFDLVTGDLENPAWS